MESNWDLGRYADFVREHGFYAAAVIGAGSGIGRAAAEHLGQLGVRVACLDRDADAAATTAGTIAEAGGASLAARADVTDPDSVERAVSETIKGLGDLHALVNCAGISGPTTNFTHEVTLEDFDNVLAINLRGALVASRAVLKHLLAKGYGRVLHVASIAGKEGNVRMGPYSTSKAGLIGLVKVMGKEYAETGITVNALAPAVIETPLVAALPEETIRYMTDRIPMRRCGDLEEVASMIAWIVSPSCSFTTGFTFDLSGGRATY